MSKKGQKFLVVDSDSKHINLMHYILKSENIPIMAIHNGEKAVEIFLDHNVLYGPGKAANAGGVAVSGLEMSQNSMRLTWSREEVDQKLQVIMNNIHQSCIEAAENYGYKGNYVVGANIAGFLKVAKAMLAYGIV